MTLYEYMRINQEDVDTYDTEYDAVVTVCYMEEEDVQDECDKFCMEITKKVSVVPSSGRDLMVDWSKLIKEHIDIFKEFTDEYWYNNYEDDAEELIYQWVREIHYYLAGYVDESTYKKLNKLLEEI